MLKRPPSVRVQWWQIPKPGTQTRSDGLCLERIASLQCVVQPVDLEAHEMPIRASQQLWVVIEGIVLIDPSGNGGAVAPEIAEIQCRIADFGIAEIDDAGKLFAGHRQKHVLVSEIRVYDARRSQGNALEGRIEHV